MPMRCRCRDSFTPLSPTMVATPPEIFDEVAAVWRDDRLMHVRVRGVWPTVGMFSMMDGEQGYVVVRRDGRPASSLGSPVQRLPPSRMARPAVVEPLQQQEEVDLPQPMATDDALRLNAQV